MTAPDTSELPVARPVDASAYVGEEPTPQAGDVDRWVGSGLAVLLALAWTLTDVGPVVLAALVVVMCVATVRRRRTGVLWWTVGEVAVFVGAAVVGLVLVHDRLTLSGVELAVQLVVGAALGAGLAAATGALERRRHA